MERLEVVMAISESVEHMARGWRQVEPDRHIQHVGLVQQLRIAMLRGTVGGAESHAPGKPVVSSPPMPEVIWLALTDCEAEVDAIAAWVGAPSRETVELTLQAILGLVGNTEDNDLKVIDYELASLRRRLEVVLSWEPADRNLYAVSCPVCGVRNSLRVQMDDYGPMLAYCSDCSTTWDRPSLASLAKVLNREETTS